MRSVRTSLGEPFAGLTLHHAEWGDARAARTVVCVHGLTRNARDFDVLAAALAADSRVMCVDVPGRGLSDRLPDPQHYQVPAYAQQLLAWLAALGVPEVDWVGTSMGGMIGMAVAVAPGTPIRRLVLNDIGAFVPEAALAVIGGYVGTDPLFASLADLEARLRTIHAGFGPLTDAQWRHLAAHSAREDADGWRLSYDPRIRDAMTEPADIDLWPLYDAIGCPTLLLRGGASGLLLPETADEMTRRGPRARLVSFDGVGHAPALMAEDQIEAVRHFLATVPAMEASP